MQARRSNRERRDATTSALLSAAHALFVERGFAGTGTPDLVAAAGLTRGALYHHFEDKKALFRAVVIEESRAVAAAIEQAAPGGADPMEDLVTGGEAYLDAMAVPGRARLLLLEAPAVLGPAEASAIGSEHGGRTLRDGLAAAIAAGALRPLPVETLATVLEAAFDRAVLSIASGAARADCSAVLRAMIEGLRPR